MLFRTIPCICLFYWMTSVHHATTYTSEYSRLVEHIFGTNRNITSDNWFSSILLINNMEELYINCKTYVCTIRNTKKEIPKEFYQTNNELKRLRYLDLKNCTLISYGQKNNNKIKLFWQSHLCTMTMNEMKEKMTKKPDIITFYNKTTTGVDLVWLYFMIF